MRTLIALVLAFAVIVLLLQFWTRGTEEKGETIHVGSEVIEPPESVHAVVMPPTTVAPTTTTTARARTAPIRAASVSRPTLAGVWDRLSQCEAGGNWHINTGNGYFGGLQMDMQFWRSYGGPAFASRADLASREQQIVVAERARDSGRGYRPWPTCARRLGLI